MRTIDLIVIHCSDSDRPEHDNVETIRQWHLERGWKDIGYHFVITKDGVCRAGRPVSEVGAHVDGYNQNSIGICLTGSHEFSKEQFETLKKTVASFAKTYGLKRPQIVGHRDLNKRKTCPNFEVKDILFSS